jgi:hypothetical protein
VLDFYHLADDRGDRELFSPMLDVLVGLELAGNPAVCLAMIVLRVVEVHVPTVMILPDLEPKRLDMRLATQDREWGFDGRRRATPHRPP